MSSKIKAFYFFNFTGRILGFTVDLMLVYFSTVLYAQSYYQLSAIPILLFSISSYTSSLLQKTSWGGDLLSNRIISLIIITSFTLLSLAIILLKNLDINVTSFLIIALVSLISGYIINTKSSKNANNIWLFPAAGTLSLVIALLGAIFAEGKINEAFYIVAIMTLIRPLVFIFNGETIKPSKRILDINKFLVIIILLCGLRHLVLVIYRFLVPDGLFIEYSFNSRIIQNAYALSILPIIYYFMDKQNFFFLKNNSIIILIFLNILVLGLSILAPKIILFKIHLNWMIPMIFLISILVTIDTIIIKKSNSNPLKIIILQLLFPCYIYWFNYFYWGINI